MKTITLRDVFKHSKIVEMVDIEGVFKLSIRPWTAVQLEVIQPLISKIYKQFKKQDKNTTVIEAFMSMCENPEYIKDIMQIVYVTLEISNETILFYGEEMKIFPEDDMRKFLTLNKLFEIIRVIWKQNIEQNPFLLSNPKSQTIDQPIQEILNQKS